MPSNPYITVPAGTTAQQNMWLQAYYRNLALQDQYAQQRAQQPDWGSALGQGLASGIGAGLQQYFGTLDTQAKYDQQWQLQVQQEQARAEAQQRLFEQQSAMETLRAQQAQLAKMQELQRLGLARTQFETGMQPTVTPQPDLITQSSVGGAEPPVVEQGTEQPPATYTDVLASPQAPSVTRPNVGNVLERMDPALVGLLPNEAIAAYRKLQDESTGLKSEDLKRYVDMMYAAMDRGDYLSALNFAKMARMPSGALLEQDPVKRAAMQKAQIESQAYSGQDVTQLYKPEALKGAGLYVEPKTPNNTASFTDWLSGNGVRSIEQYYALPDATRTQLFKEFGAYQVRQQGEIGARIEASKLQVAQPAPSAESEKFTQLRLVEGTLANIDTLIRKVDLSHIAGYVQNSLADMARTGQWHGIPVPEALRPTLTDDENRLLTAMDNAADFILRQRSGGTTAETEMRRMLGFLATGRATPQSIQQSLTVLQDTLDIERRARTEAFQANHWLIPENTSFTKARQLLRQHGKVYDDTAVQLFLRDNPEFR